MSAPENTSGATVLKVAAWVIWAAFLLFSIGAFVFAEAEKADVYFVRYYGLHTMNTVTKLVTTYPAWLTILPFLWLPFFVAYQRKSSPRLTGLLLVSATLFLMSICVSILLLCVGPPIQM